MNYLQVKEILLQTADDLADPGWDVETGQGLLDVEEAVERAKQTKGKTLTVSESPILSFTGKGRVTPSVRPASEGTETAIARRNNLAFYVNYLSLARYLLSSNTTKDSAS
ncbi:MAG: hypothetical protein F6J93_00715 [Oscillatoria sp. SIO1A7]|nr:hypothetical protein [Oscillatoria sp. SIO1A7]